MTDWEICLGCQHLTKLQERAKRFGISTPEVEAAKKAARAERFGVVAKVWPVFRLLDISIEIWTPAQECGTAYLHSVDN